MRSLLRIGGCRHVSYWVGTVLGDVCLLSFSVLVSLQWILWWWCVCLYELYIMCTDVAYMCITMNSLWWCTFYMCTHEYTLFIFLPTIWLIYTMRYILYMYSSSRHHGISQTWTHSTNRSIPSYYYAYLLYYNYHLVMYGRIFSPLVNKWFRCSPA